MVNSLSMGCLFILPSRATVSEAERKWSAEFHTLHSAPCPFPFFNVPNCTGCIQVDIRQTYVCNVLIWIFGMDKEFELMA